MIEYIIGIIISLFVLSFLFGRKSQQVDNRLDDMEAELRCLLEKYERAKKIWKC